MTSSALLPYIDFTYLNDNEAELMRFLEKAQSPSLSSLASICVYPQHIKMARQHVSLAIATVLNFPSGDHSMQHFVKESALSEEADELDIVFPYQPFLQSNKQLAFDLFEEKMAKLPKDKTIKVIIESGLYPKTQDISEVCQFLIKQPIHFIKTSTGKAKHGASLAAADAILNVIANTNIGLKVSGGIKTTEQAMQYKKLAEEYLTSPLTKDNFRIGASTLSL